MVDLTVIIAHRPRDTAPPPRFTPPPGTLYRTTRVREALYRVLTWTASAAVIIVAYVILHHGA